MLTNVHQPIKIAIIGTGRVGASCSYALQLLGLASEIVLINTNRQRAEGEAMDINHGTQFTKPIRVWAGDYGDCRDIDIFVLAAGTTQRPGDTRLDLLRNNAAILEQTLAPALKYIEDANMVVAANWVDVLTYLTWQMTGMNGRHALNDVALSLPSVVNRQGIASTLEVLLSAEEENGLLRSVQVIQDAVQSLHLHDQIRTGRTSSAHLLLEQRESV